MIIARSPLRVTLGGGGTDLPSYYEKFGGFLVNRRTFRNRTANPSAPPSVTRRGERAMIINFSGRFFRKSFRQFGDGARFGKSGVRFAF